MRIRSGSCSVLARKWASSFRSEMKILARSCLSARTGFSRAQKTKRRGSISARERFRRSGLTRYTLTNASSFLDPLRAYSLTQTPTYHSRRHSGAGDGSRTRLYSLGSCRSTDELHPQGTKTLSQYVTWDALQQFQGGSTPVALSNRSKMKPCWQL